MYVVWKVTKKIIVDIEFTVTISMINIPQLKSNINFSNWDDVEFSKIGEKKKSYKKDGSDNERLTDKESLGEVIYQ